MHLEQCIVESWQEGGSETTNPTLTFLLQSDLNLFINIIIVWWKHIQGRILRYHTAKQMRKRLDACSWVYRYEAIFNEIWFKTFWSLWMFTFPVCELLETACASQQIEDRRPHIVFYTFHHLGLVCDVGLQKVPECWKE